MQKYLLFAWYLLPFSCKQQPATNEQAVTQQASQNTEVSDHTDVDVANMPMPAGSYSEIETGSTTPAELIAYAKTLIGTPYLYGSTDPAKGFDCSGFITSVFNHFKISVPRSSIDFTDVQSPVALQSAKAGDIILFTGTDESVRQVGHMGIIVSDGEPKEFIHSTSGKAYGVTISPLTQHYMGRFVKVIRVFKQNNR